MAPMLFVLMMAIAMIAFFMILLILEVSILVQDHLGLARQLKALILDHQITLLRIVQSTTFDAYILWLGMD